MSLMLRVVLVSMVVSFGTASGDWPTYRGDATRSGYTPQGLDGAVTPVWRYEAGRSDPAWPRSGRMSFDQAYQPVIADGAVFFGSSADHALYRLDLASGEGGPIFVADGPIRFAPAVWRDRLFVVSDDGHLSCLDFDGEVVWSRRGGLDGSLRLGNGQLISKWPARGGPVVVDDVVYYAAGIWPTDEIFVHAVGAEDGEPVWTNDDSGGIYMSQPHGGAEAESGVSAQGYLVVSGTEETNVSFPDGGSEDGDAPNTDDDASEAGSSPRLLVPTGRAVPASFDLATGEFEYFHLQQYGKRGGFATMAVGPMFFNSGIAFDVTSGQEAENLGDGPIVAVPGGLVRSTRGGVIAYRWTRQTKTDRRGNQSESWGLKPDWSSDGVDGGNSLIVAGNIVVAGGEGVVTLLERDSGAVIARHDVDGTVYGLAASDGRLVASTDSGVVVGFGPARGSKSDGASREGTRVTVRGPASETGLASAESALAEMGNAATRRAAEEILDAGGVREGYCLDFGCGEGDLAAALAMQSELRIYAVDDDPESVRVARERLRAAGLYGTRVTVHHVDDLERLPHPRYFANLVVSGRSVDGAWVPDVDGVEESDRGAESRRLGEPDGGYRPCLRPYGGVVRFGRPGEMRTARRGALRGAGEWTHQYGSASNQLCSSDELIEGPLGMLWYRDIDIDVPPRHGRAPAPLFSEGLLYHEGIDELVCVDAYNGRVVWRHALPGVLKAYDGDELMGVAGTGSNFCIGDAGVYVRQEGHCVRLDRRTGEVLGKFSAPPQADGEPGTWGYVAVEGNRLYGSLADRGHQVTYRFRATTGDMSDQLTESRTIFVMDSESGELKWRYDAKDSIRHNAIAADADHVYVIDRPQATFDRTKEGKSGDHPPGVLLALDAETGKEAWRNEQQIDGTMLAVSPEHRRLLMSYQPTRFSLASEVGGMISAFSTDDGTQTWRNDASYASRPLINDYTVYAQGGSWDLLTGEEQPFDFSRSYGCGVLAGARNMMVFRSATLGYYDLHGSGETQNYGGMRPGCWINAIPAGGLVMVPDASAGCTCSYLNQSWMALEPIGVSTPVVEPAGGSFAEPVEVRIEHPDREGTIRYTTDGSSPTSTSTAYDGALMIEADTRLRARFFTDNGRLSRSVDRSFTIDPNTLPLEDSSWRVWDVPGNPASAPSDWSVEAGVVKQRSNIYLGSATETDPEVERYGTLRIFGPGASFTDGRIEAEIRSADDDGIGLAFRCEDAEHHYLWAADLQRRFRILARKDGDDYRLLARNDLGYGRNEWLKLRIDLDGDRIRVTVDGEEDFSVRDGRFGKGTIALYSWGSTNVEFRKVRFERRGER